MSSQAARPLMVRFAVASLLFLAPLLLLPLAGATRGDAWVPLGLRGETVLAMAVAGNSTDRVVYAETHTGLWRYTASEGWSRIDESLPCTPLGGPALAAWRVVPGRARVLYAVTGVGTARQLYRSDDGGTAWQLVGPAPGQMARPPMIVLAGWSSPSPKSNPGPGSVYDTITLATDSRVQRSTDGGATWVPGGPWPGHGKADSGRDTAPVGGTHVVHALLGDSNAPDRLYALADDGALWLSESGGRAWRVVQGPANWSGRPVTALAIVPYFGIHIWAATADGLSLSTDNGLNWTTQPLPAAALGRGKDPVILLTDPRVPDTIYVTLGNAVYRSDDSGITWSDLGRPNGQRIATIVLDGDTRALLYAATNDGVWVRSVVPLTPAVLEEAMEAGPEPAATDTPEPTPSATVSPTGTTTFTPIPPPTETATPSPTETSSPTLTSTRMPSTTPTRTRTLSAQPPSGTPSATFPPTAEFTVEPSPPPPPRPTDTHRPPTSAPTPVPTERPTSAPPTATPFATPVPR